VLAGGQLFGFVGILLALPAAAVIMVLLRRMHDNYRTSLLYGSDHRDEPDDVDEAFEQDASVIPSDSELAERSEEDGADTARKEDS
jgi:hypothetical protein